MRLRRFVVAPVIVSLLLPACLFCLGTGAQAAPATKTGQTQTPKGDKQPAKDDKRPDKEKAAGQADKKLEPIKFKLPRPAFKGTPKHVPPGTKLEKARKGPRPPFLAPKGAKNVAAGKPVTSSDDDPIIGEIKCVNDGDKEADEGSYVELGPGLQYMQIDLKSKHEIHALLVWHFHVNARIYHDVVVQVADDKDFITNVRTVYNNDHDNSSGLGMGDEMEYWDIYEGKLMDAKGVKARYVRLYSNGSTEDDMNHYTEVEVFGLPIK